MLCMLFMGGAVRIAPDQSGGEGVIVNIVALGVGLGGSIMADEMADQIGQGDTITVVTNGPNYHFVPSNP